MLFNVANKLKNDKRKCPALNMMSWWVGNLHIFFFFSTAFSVSALHGINVDIGSTAGDGRYDDRRAFLFGFFF